MPVLCDVNVLLAICDEDHAHYETVHAWLNKIESKSQLIVCRFSQLSLLRLLTTSAVMLRKPFNMAGAWRVYETLMVDERMIFLSEPFHMDSVFKAIVPGNPTAPKLWQDAYLAAFAISAQMQLVSLDSDHRQFRNLDLILLT